MGQLEGTVARGPGGRRERAAQPRLRAHHVADRRRHRASAWSTRATSCTRAIRAGSSSSPSSIRSRWSSRCRRTTCRASRRRCSHGPLTVEASARDGTADARQRQARARRQPDQPGDRDDPAQGGAPEPAAAALAERSSSRRGSCSSRAARRARRAGRRRVQRGPNGTFVYVVGGRQGRRAAAGRGRLDRGRASRSSRSGLEEGERVVVDGQNQLRPGSKVQAREAGQPGGGRAAGAGAAAPSPLRPGARAPRDEHLRAVHPAAGRDDAAHDRPPARGHRRLPAAPRRRAARRSTTRRSSSRRTLPGASAETMASAGDDAARAPVRADAVARADDVGVELRQLADHAAVRRSTATSTPPSRTCRPRSTPRRTCLPRTLPAPPTYSKSNPADTPILTLASSSETLPLDAGRRLRRLDPRAEDLAGLRRRPRHAQRRPEARGARAGRSARARRRRASRSRTCARRSSRRTSTSRRATSTAPRQDYTLATNDQLDEGSGVPADRRRLPERRAGPPRRRRATSSTASRTTQLAGWAGDRARHHPQRPAPAGRERHRGRRPREGAAAAAHARRSRRGIEVHILSRPHRDRARLGRGRRVHARAHDRPRRGRHLRVPAQRCAPPSSPASPCRCRSSARSAIMYLLGYSLNNLSLMALTISTGFVVDDAIVMIENIARYVEQGDAPFEAALKGAKQIGFTIVSLTVSLVAVLIPLLFMGGHHRAALPRVRGDARHRHRRLGGALAHAHRDDVRAPPEARAAAEERGPPLRASPSAASTRMLAALRPRPALGARAPAARRSSSPSRRVAPHRAPRGASCRRASSRSRTPGSSSASPRRRPTSPSRG